MTHTTEGKCVNAARPLARARGTTFRSAGLQPLIPSGAPMTDQTSFDTVTRIAAGDDGTNYDPVAIWLHWTMALLVIFQCAAAITWDYFSKPAAETMQSLHVSLGVLLTAV